MNKKGKYSNPFRATLMGIRDLYGKKRTKLTLPANIDLTDRRVLITGASSGLGFATAKRMAAAGAEVLMAVRSGIPEKGNMIRRDTGNEDIHMFPVDLVDFNSIDRLVEALAAYGKPINLIVSNAAMVPLESRQTPQGLEEMFMVNYLSAFYLINRLLAKDILRPVRGKDPRIIIISSESHRNPEAFDWEQFGKYEPYGIKETVARYGYYKLLLTTFANELSRRAEVGGKPVPVRILCPGPVNSNIAREAPVWMQPILKLVFGLFFKSPNKASDPVLYFAAESGGEGEPIRYLFTMEEKEMDEKATDPVNGQKLWEMSVALIEEKGFRI